jgi:cobalt-zinc-cadmium efflux system protein
LVTPEPVQAGFLIWVATIGIAINLGTALMFASGRKGDLNVRGAFVHMLGDAAVAFGVVLAGLAIRTTGLTWIDPIVSILVAGIVLWASWKVLQEAFLMAMDAVPAKIDIRQVRAYFEGLPGVESVHDLHIWSMGTTECALTVHLVRPEGATDDFLGEVCHELQHRFKIDHPTVQVERGDGATACMLAPEG